LDRDRGHRAGREQDAPTGGATSPGARLTPMISPDRTGPAPARSRYVTEVSVDTLQRISGEGGISTPGSAQPAWIAAAAHHCRDQDRADRKGGRDRRRRTDAKILKAQARPPWMPPTIAHARSTRRAKIAPVAIRAPVRMNRPAGSGKLSIEVKIRCAASNFGAGPEKGRATPARQHQRHRDESQSRKPRISDSPSAAFVPCPLYACGRLEHPQDRRRGGHRRADRQGGIDHRDGDREARDALAGDPSRHALAAPNQDQQEHRRRPAAPA
jgi:hypothetical protein